MVEFIGRDQKLLDLHIQLQQNNRIAITAIAGMGGIGKTELALQYAIAQFQHQTYPAGLCWLTCRVPEIATQIVSFAKTKLLLTIPDDLEAKEQVDLIWRRWSEGNALIVLDDVTDYDAISHYLPPPDPRFKVLITTRQNFGASVTTINIEELSDEAAIALLKSIVGDDRIEVQRGDAQALCKWVGNLPLGLELLGRFLVGKEDWAIAKLLEQLESKRLAAKALIETESGMTATLGVAAALELSWAELSQPQQDLACLLGMFAVAPIPWSLVESCFSEADSDDLEDWRDEGLRDRSLIKRVEQGTYQLHQIAQEYFRYKLQSYLEQGKSLKAFFCKALVDISEHIKETPSAQEMLKIQTSIIHIEELAVFWNNNLANDDLIWPYVGLSRFYAGKGLFSLAEDWAKRCLEIVKTNCGEESIAFIMSLNNLAIQNITQGHFIEGESNIKKAHKLCENNSSLKEISNKILNNLAEIYLAKGEYVKAKELHTQILSDRRKYLPPDHSDIALSLNNLGHVLNKLNYHIDAQSVIEEALKILELSSPNEQRLIATCIENLGIAYQGQGCIQDAESRYLQALRMNEKKFGERHPDTVVTLSNLATCFESQGEFIKAKEILNKALEITQEHQIVDIGYLLNSLAKVNKSIKNYSESEKLFNQAIQVAREYYGIEHDNVAVYLNNLAGLYLDQKIYDKAEHFYLESIQIKRTIFGDKSISVAIGLNNLAYLYWNLGLLEKAQEYFEEAFQIFSIDYGKKHPDTQNILQNLEIVKKAIKNIPRKKKKFNHKTKGFGAK